MAQMVRKGFRMTEFEQASYQAAKSFLGTVIVVDNMAQFPAEAEPVELVEPSDTDSAPVGQDDAEQVAEVAGAEMSEDDGPLNAGVLTAAFAEFGLVCGIIRPQTVERRKDAILKGAANADIVVLDWQMDDEGELAIEIIRELIADDERAGGRLRLIAIYTGHSLASVGQKLEAEFPHLQSSADKLAFEAKSHRVVVAAKDFQANAVDTNGSAVTETELPHYLIGQFAKFTGGLLPNATMAAISGVRRHTHRMLARFTKELDGPLLTHRVLLSKSGDAEQFAADLIMGELDAQVPIHQIVADYLNADQVKAYFSHCIAAGLRPKLMLNNDGSLVSELNLDEVSKFVEGGLKSLSDKMDSLADEAGQKDSRSKFRETLKDRLYDRLYGLTTPDLELGRRNHTLFAQRYKLKREITSVDRAASTSIKLGSILAGADKYWLCMTPLCDSTRLKAGDRLLFAELTLDSKLFELVVPDGDNSLFLRVNRKRTNLASFKFNPDDTGHVSVRESKGELTFSSMDDDPSGTRAVHFRWLGELKPLHAQRFMQAFTSNLSRVGIDEFEWHRMQMHGEGAPQ